MEQNNSSVYITRPDFLYELQEVMKEHSITLQQAVTLYQILYKITHAPIVEDNNALFMKGLLKAGNVVSIRKLFKDKSKREQLSLAVNFETFPKLTEQSTLLVKNLKEAFVLDEDISKKIIKQVADEWFKGDLSVAEHFIIFQYMFPKTSEVGKNIKWNLHFGFSYEGDSRWQNSVLIAKKFHKIYNTKDIGLFLNATYFYIKDSINFDSGECYATKPNKFLDTYKSWYDLAKERLQIRDNIIELNPKEQL